MSKRSAGVAFEDGGDGVDPRAAKKAKDDTDSDDDVWGDDIGAGRADAKGGGAGGGASGRDESSDTLYTLHLVGWKRHKKGQGLAVGVEVRLDREPENRFDPNAVKVFCPSLERWVGYIMAGEASHLARALDTGDAAVRRAVLREAPAADLEAKPLCVEICFSKLDEDAKAGGELARVLSIPFDLANEAGATADDEPSLPTGFALPPAFSSSMCNPEGVSQLAFARRFPPSRQDPSRFHWVYVHAIPAEYRGVPAPAEPGNYMGKWMIMNVPASKADLWFAEVARSVEAGEFCSAKTNAGPGKGRGGTGVIIAYTQDFRDRSDVLRAGEALKRRFGRAVVLKYKADVLTYGGVYSRASNAGGGYGAKGRQKSCIYTMKAGGLGLTVEEGLYELSLQLAKEGGRKEGEGEESGGNKGKGEAAAAAAAAGSGTAEDPIEL